MGSTTRTIAQRTLIIAIFSATHAAFATAQPGQGANPPTANVEVDPIRCWWRTSSSAIRIGEPFSIVLTCAVVENGLNTVVPDESQIEPAALQLPPFEVTGGRRFGDRRSPDHRFFQYEYQARLVQEDVFGADVPLPPLEIRYRIRTQMPDGSEVDGREASYLLPTVSLRVLSLVPRTASDIREATGSTFGEVDDLAFRASALRVVALVLFGFGGVVAIPLLLGIGRRFVSHDQRPHELISAVPVLRRVSRELSAVRRQRAYEGWSDALVGRALAALRIVGTYALDRRTGQATAPATAQEYQGLVVMPFGWLSDTIVLVSGSVTAATVNTALANAAPSHLRRTDLEELQSGLARFSAAQYGRQGESRDESALDESLQVGLVLARRLAVQQFWPVKKFRALTARVATVGRRVWPR